MNPLLEAEDLDITLFARGAPVHAVRKVQLTIHQGETLALVGESGCGKSTMAKALIRLLPQQAHVTGKILYQGENILQFSEKEMQRLRGTQVSFVLQDALSALNPTMMIGKQILETIRQHAPKITTREARKRVRELLLRVELQEYHYRAYPHELSGGMRQRALLAIALSPGPKLLIADEPTTALDPATQKEILTLLQSLQRENGLSILFITHDLHAVKAIADRIHVMREGCILERAYTATLFSAPNHPYTKSLLSANTANDKKRGSSISHKDPFIRIVGLYKSYLFHRRSIDVLQNFTLTIYHGEILGLLGKSGSGKSTLARLLLCLEKPNSGSIFFEDRSLFHMKKRELFAFRKECQIVFQDPASSLNPRTNIETILCEPLLIHKQKIERDTLAHSLVRVGLDPAFLERYPHELSGGQRQRVALARALILHPRFLICDEAISMLDAYAQMQILSLLKQLAKELQLTILFIAHDVQIVQAFADRVIRITDKPKHDKVPD